MRIKRWAEQRGFFVIVSEMWYGEWKGVDYAAAALAGDGSTGFGVCAQPPNLQGQSLKTEAPVCLWSVRSLVHLELDGNLFRRHVARLEDQASAQP
jgi:hypothetical protein